MNRYHAILTSILLLCISGSAFSANECRIKYQFNDGNNKRTTRYLNLNAGQTKSVNQRNMDYVRNLKTNRVKLTNYNSSLRHRYNYELDKNAQDPAVGLHMAIIKLEKVTCLKNKTPQTPEDMVQQMRASGETASNIAQSLKNTLSLTIEDVAAALKQGGFSAGDSAKALKQVFNASATQVITTIKSVWGISKQTATNILKAAGYGMSDAAMALRNAFNTTPQQTAQLLFQVFRGTVKNVVIALKEAGFSVLDTAKGVIASNVSPADVGIALNTTWQLTADTLCRTLKQAGYSKDQAYEAIRAALRLGKSRINEILRNAGYQVQDTATSASRTFKLQPKAISK